MNRVKLKGILLVIFGIIVVVGSSYAILNYAGGVLNSMLDFITTNDFAKLQSCGVNIPPGLVNIKSDIGTILLPFLYLGLPMILIMLSILMFFGGYYYHKGRYAEILAKRRMQKDVSKIAQKYE